jgi:hypothetical protein
MMRNRQPRRLLALFTMHVHAACMVTPPIPYLFDMT